MEIVQNRIVSITLRQSLHPLHTRPLVREGAPQKQDNKFQTQSLEKETISGQTSTK
jgi:hypothetical protein